MFAGRGPPTRRTRRTGVALLVTRHGTAERGEHGGAAPTWVRCWVERGAPKHALRCRYDAPDAKQPIKPSWVVVAVTDMLGRSHSKDLHDKAGQNVLVASLGDEAFPMEMAVSVSTSDLEKVGLERTTLISTRRGVLNADAAAHYHPVVVKQPFDLWPVTVIQRHSSFSLQVERRPVSIAPWTVGQARDASLDAFAVGAANGRAQGSKSTHYFIAPEEGGLSARYEAGRAPSRVSIAAPGVYVADEDGFRLATSEDANGTSPARPPASTDAAAPPVACGVAGQKCCAHPSMDGFGGTCAGGSFCFANENTCTSCGKPGQKCCGGPRSDGFGGSCEVGATCTAYGNTCVAR